MTKQKKMIKKRYIFLAVSVVLILLFSGIYIIIVGQTYKLTLETNLDTLDLNKLNTKITVFQTNDTNTEHILKIKSVTPERHEEGMYIVFEFQSVGEGTVSFQAVYDGNLEDIFLGTKTLYSQKKYMSAEEQKGVQWSYLNMTNLHVNALGIIYDTVFDKFSGEFILFPVNLLILMLFVVVMGITFRERRKAGRFSYTMVILVGFILYMIGNIITLLLSILGNLTSFKNILTLTLGNGFYFILMTSPLLLILAIAVSISNISLIRHEGFRIVNLLGLILGITMLTHLILSFAFYNLDFSGITVMTPVRTIISCVLEYTLCYMECMLFSIIICAVLSTKYKVPYNKDYIIILGCAIRKDGTPTPILRGRIDRAIAFEREQYEATGKHAVFIPSGGQGNNEIMSEAQSMKNYLMEQGIPERQILTEDKSVNTFQNMAFSKKVIEQHAGDLKKVNIAFSTTNYHVFRGYVLAKKLGMKVHGLSAKTRLYFYPNAFIREFIGLLYDRKLRHILFVILLILTYTPIILLLGNE